MYSNSILSEGLAISIYILFIRFCLEYIIHKNKKSFLICLFLCFLGISCRKQMAVLLVIFFLSVLYAKWKDGIFKTMAISTLSLIVTLFAVMVLDYSYNYFVRGQFDGHVDDNRFISTMVFYTADREFVKYIENEEIQKVFLDIYDICESKGYLMSQAEDNWYDACDHFANSYDLIQIDTMLTYLREEVPNLDYAKEIASTDVRMDLIKAEINRSLLIHELGRIVTIVKNNFLDGLVNTVAKRTPILCLYSIIAYTGYLFLYVSMIVMGKKKGFTISCKSTIIFSSLVIVSILLNTLLVSAVIFAQTRYVIYNMPLFYSSAFLMLYENYRLITRR